MVSEVIMPMPQRCLLIVLWASMVLYPRESTAVFGVGDVVFDPSVFGQAVIEVAQSFSMLQNMIKDVAPLAHMGQAMQVVLLTQSVLAQVDGLAHKIQARAGIWTTKPVFTTMQDLSRFRETAAGYCQQSRIDALSVQSLLADASRLSRTLSALIDSIGILTGSVAGLQAVSTELTGISGQLATLQATAAANHEATLCESWSREYRRQGLVILQQQLFRDYGFVGQQ